MYGEILYKNGNGYEEPNCVFILKDQFDNNIFNYYGAWFFDRINEDTSFNKYISVCDDTKVRIATAEEQQLLSNALRRRGKYWNTDEKQIKEIPNCEYKPFTKVIVRYYNSDVWKVDMFSHMDHNWNYVCIGGKYTQCIPYSNKTAHLISTIDEYKED